MAKVGKVIAGTALIVTGAVIGVTTGQWSIALAVASMGLGLVTARNASLASLNERQGMVLSNRVGPLQYLPVVYGTAKIAPIFADIRVDTASLNRKQLVLVPAFCHGSQDGGGIMGIDEVWFDDRLAIDNLSVVAPFNTPNPEVKFSPSYLIASFHLGLAAPVVDTTLNNLFALEWPASSKGAGVAYIAMQLWYNQTIYPGGIPNIQAVIRGNRVYDPRDGTYKYSTNPALCIRDYLTSTVYGCGVPTANIEDQSFIDMANYCDEQIATPNGLQARFTLNGWVDTSKAVEQNLADLCTACRGQVINEGDRWRLIIRRQRSASGFKLTEKNTVEGSWQFILPGNETSPNVGRASYIDPSANYDVNTIQWPDPATTNTFLSDDNNFEQRLEIDLPFTTDKIIAQQIIMTLVKEQRSAISVICTLKEEALQMRVGELVQVSQPTPGWTDKPFDVVSMLLASDGTVQAVLVEYQATSYDYDVQFSQPTIPDTDLPDPFSTPAPSSLVLVSAGQEQTQNDGGYIGRIRATWTKANDPFLDYTIVQARRLLSTDVVEGVAPFDSTHFTHSGLSAFTASLIWNDDTSGNAWHTDSAVAGAWLQVDCGSGITKEFVECRIYAAGAYAGVYNIEYSDNGSVWSLASAAFNPTGSGLHSQKWASVGAHRYWRIKLTNTPGASSWLNELQFKEPAWDDFGRVAGLDSPLVYIYPVTIETWQVRIRAINKIGVASDWLSGTHTVVVPDPRPQVTSITLINTHADTHSDVAHQDVAHGDSAHVDTHTDTAHTDHTDHNDAHSDSGSHDDVSHADSHGDVGDIDTDHTDTHSDNPHSDHADGHADSHTDSNHLDNAHVDNHGDVGSVDTDHTDTHTDSAHSDHSDSGFSHTDVTHVDSHTDTAHSDSAHNDSHTDAHSDGQNGIGVAIQADSDSASVKAAARIYKSFLANGGGEFGTVGSQATGWTFSNGNNLVPDTGNAYQGVRSLKLANPSGNDSFSYQDITVVSGQLYQVSGWVRVDSALVSGGGGGAYINIDNVSGISGFTIIEKVTRGTDTNPTQPDCGVRYDASPTPGWIFVYCRFTCTGSGTIRVYLQLGYGGNITGTVWFDDVRFEMAEPNAADVRATSVKNGRNVTLDLIDAATGAQVLLGPGDQIRIGALAYSLVNAQGVEGPLGMGSGALFNVAPVGTDKWVPS